jgi:hypothetical protein
MRRKYRYELTAKAHLTLSEEQKCPICGKRVIEGVSLEGKVFKLCVRSWEHPPRTSDLEDRPLVEDRWNEITIP